MCVHLTQKFLDSYYENPIRGEVTTDQWTRLTYYSDYIHSLCTMMKVFKPYQGVTIINNPFLP